MSDNWPTNDTMKFPNYRILYFVPNIIGYVRIILLVASWIHIDSDPKLFVVLYVASVVLDALDGIAARKLNQTSAFGAWFDVVIDNVGRGMLWSFIYKWGYFVSALEWLVLVCTHTYGPTWKTAGTDTPPFWVKAVMANNFRTVIGSYAIAGLHVLPMWLYGLQKLEIIYTWLGSQAVAGITAILVSGRLICALVE
ncbi:CDP-diacylglycerol--inositol 3-phosphatidyltransferase, partial [Paramuricea clavata]